MTSMLFKLFCANNIILSCFFYFFLIIDLYFLIPEVIAYISNSVSKILFPIEIMIEIEIHPVNIEIKIRKLSMRFRSQKRFCGSYL